MKILAVRGVGAWVGSGSDPANAAILKEELEAAQRAAGLVSGAPHHDEGQEAKPHTQLLPEGREAGSKADNCPYNGGLS